MLSPYIPTDRLSGFVENVSKCGIIQSICMNIDNRLDKLETLIQQLHAQVQHLQKDVNDLKLAAMKTQCVPINQNAVGQRY